ncbi:MAG: shikimate kinase [Eubacteriales bacterium]|nr:shikimate kinase [Eubacteriales bacterium]
MQYGLIGEHLGHSYSCEIHGKIADYKYELKEIAPEDLDAFMREASFKAINVTIPYKQAVIPYLYEISSQAEEIGAVNTVVNHDGRLYGYNTDFMGMAALFEKMGVSLSGKKVLILGTGGTSKTAVAVAKDGGAREIIKVSRHAGTDGDVVPVVTYEEAVAKHSDAEIIINTTPSGMYPNVENVPIDVSAFKNLEGVLDAVYNPLRTNLVLDAHEHGVAAEGGLYMLAGQAVYASAEFQDIDIDKTLIDVAYRTVRDKKRNLVMTGMPSSGKTTVGKLLAEKMGLKFVDTDDLIVEKIGCSISDFMHAHGEKAFRDVESEVIKGIASESGMVIATGGGAVLRSENIRALKRNGVVIFLDRALENLITTDDRPLSSSREALEKRYSERIDIYRGTADIIVDANTTLNEEVEDILSKLQGDA